MLYKALGFVVWKAATRYVRLRYGPPPKRRMRVGAGLALAAAAAVAVVVAAQRRPGP